MSLEVNKRSDQRPRLQVPGFRHADAELAQRCERILQAAPAPAAPAAAAAERRARRGRPSRRGRPRRQAARLRAGRERAASLTPTAPTTARRAPRPLLPEHRCALYIG